MKKRTFSTGCAILLLLSFIAGCGRNPNASVTRSNFFFDTIITITIYGTTDSSDIDACFELAGEYEKKFSNTITDSEVSQINANAGSYVTVSDETVELIEQGIAYGELSNGTFDITIGNLSDLWDFSEIAANLESDDNEADASVLPSDTDIESARSHVDYHLIQIDGNKVMLTDPESKLDLGGIAKGYIADRMKELLLERGVTSATINLGGNVLTVGEHADGSAYTIGIQKPFAETGETIAVIKVKDKSVVSSGVYERYYRIAGRLYHHILDVDTGYPYDNGLYEVTIISSSSVDGDALSTTCFALGLEDGMALVESLDNTDAVFVTSEYEIYTTSGVGTSIPFEETK